MTKQEFITQLRDRLAGLPQSDIEESVIFYTEIIDDKIEDGLSEAAAVDGLGSIDEIVSQIASNTPLSKIVKEKIKPKDKKNTWKIVLLIVGSPIWASLLITLFAVVFTIYVCLWAVIISLWATFASFIGGALMGIILAITSICCGNIHSGILLFGASSALTGLAILLFFCCRAATKVIILFTKKLSFFIKKCFVRKEEA